MGSWLLLIIAVAVTPALWRVIDVAGKIWRERAYVTAQCIDGCGGGQRRHALRATPRRDHSPGHAAPG
jgi:hypothetical protein